MTSFLLSLSVSSYLFPILAYESNCRCIFGGEMIKKRFSAYSCPWICSHWYFTMAFIIFFVTFIRVPWEPDWEPDSESICFPSYSFLSLHLKVSGTNKTFKSDRVGSFLITIYVDKPKFLLCNFSYIFKLSNFYIRIFSFNTFHSLVKCHILE